MEINETGTEVLYQPGLISGGKISHDCALSRGIGYYLEALIVLSPFAKKPIVATLRGVTNEALDVSVDVIRTAMVPLMREFGVEDEYEIKVLKRGAQPNGGGVVTCVLPTAKALRPIQKVHAGSIRRVRGLAYTTRVSPMFGSRMLDACKAIMTEFTSDVYIYTDHYKGADTGNSPGFALSLVGETDTGCMYAAEACGEKTVLPEDTGEAAALAALEEFSRGGCISSCLQCLALVLMALTPEDVSTMRFGMLTQSAIGVLRLLRDFFGLTFKLDADGADRTVLVSCVGIAYSNMARIVK